MELVLTIESNIGRNSIQIPEGFCYDAIKDPTIQLDGILHPLQDEDYGNVSLTYDGRQVALVCFERRTEIEVIRNYSKTFESGMITLIVIFKPCITVEVCNGTIINT